MKVTWDGWQTTFKSAPTIRVDGKIIRNATEANDETGVVYYVKGKKLLAATGVVEIIGERI